MVGGVCEGFEKSNTNSEKQSETTDPGFRSHFFSHYFCQNAVLEFGGLLRTARRVGGNVKPCLDDVGHPNSITHHAPAKQRLRIRVLLQNQIRPFALARTLQAPPFFSRCALDVGRQQELEHPSREVGENERRRCRMAAAPHARRPLFGFQFGEISVQRHIGEDGNGSPFPSSFWKSTSFLMRACDATPTHRMTAGRDRSCRPFARARDSSRACENSGIARSVRPSVSAFNTT